MAKEKPPLLACGCLLLFIFCVPPFVFFLCRLTFKITQWVNS